MRTATALILLVAVLAGCEGPMGPSGPAGTTGATGATGPQGPVGPRGTTTLTYQGRLDSDGSVVVFLPAEAGSINALPIVSCYVSNSSVGPFVQQGPNVLGDAACSVGVAASTGNLAVVIAFAPAFYYYRVSVVY